jgi:hypothetical protein
MNEDLGYLEDHGKYSPEKLDIWFMRPIKKLEALKDWDADAGFIVMGSAIALYERFLIKKAQGIPNRHPEKDKMESGGEDLEIGKEKFSIFWECFRNGLQHQFHPKQTNGNEMYDWSLSKENPDIPEVRIIQDGRKYSVKVNPWGFARLVRNKFKEYPDFFESAKSHKPGTIRALGDSPQTDHKTPDTVYSPTPHHPPSQYQNSQKPKYQTQSLQTGVFRLEKPEDRSE